MLAEQKLKSYKNLQIEILLVEQGKQTKVYTKVLIDKDLQDLEVVLVRQVEKVLFHLKQVEEEKIINGKSNFSIHKAG
jgi:hypothetical protein